MIKSILIIMLSSILVNNFVLSRFLGICPFLGVSKKVETAVANKDAAAAADALKVAIVEINKAGSKGVYHKNTCSRKISRLTKAVNGIA